MGQISESWMKARDAGRDGKRDRELIRFTLEYAAHLISPPQEDGEDNEFECIDVADALRGSASVVLREWRKR